MGKNRQDLAVDHIERLVHRGLVRMDSFVLYNLVLYLDFLNNLINTCILRNRYLILCIEYLVRMVRDYKGSLVKHTDFLVVYLHIRANKNIQLDYQLRDILNSDHTDSENIRHLQELNEINLIK